MKYLLDTNVISEIRHPQGDVDVKRRIGELDPASMFTSAIVFAELHRGVLLLPVGKRKQDLLQWLNLFGNKFASRILAFDQETSQIWGAMAARAEQVGKSIGISDGQIAATGIQHGLVIITRNVSHFTDTGAQLWNVWEE